MCRMYKYQKNLSTNTEYISEVLGKCEKQY